ncbi:S-layer homology domain-containing protein [Paenibacillaceae bacterium WGS1546]|uniref:S-layer homology domain-containing protein n=1 Tax=Cohnella sp. WGS1546 TaxID=3366810 RepID=UPI00372D20D6
MSSALGVRLVDVDSNPVAEASWPDLSVDGDGEWLMEIEETRLTPTSGDLADGQYTLLVWGVGFDRNTAAKETEIRVDNETPDIQLSASSVNADKTVTITADVTDGNSGVLLEKWAFGELSAGDFADRGTAFEDSFAANRNGKYTVYAKDYAGNEAVKTIAISAIPSSSAPSPSSGAPAAPLSSDSKLRSLQVWADGVQLPLTPAFKPDVLAYAATTEADRVELRAEPSSSAARMTLQPEGIDRKAVYPLNMGTNRIEISVQAENGQETTYLIEVVRHSQPQFFDIAGHWAERDILKAAEAELAQGYPDGTFRPDALVTRVEFAVMLARALKLEGEARLPDWSDRGKIGDWSAQAVAQAFAANLVRGYPDNSFRPDAFILRSEAAAMLSRALDEPAAIEETTSFADDSAIPAWSKPAVATLAKLGIVNGRDRNRFEPDALTTRAEAVVLLLRLMDHL